MPEHLEAYRTVAALLGAGVLIVVLAMVLNRLVRPSLPSAGKATTYECGIDPVGRDWAQTRIRYYLLAFLFVVFDVEAVFVFPWAITLGQSPHQAFVLGVMLVFLALVAVTLPYEWRKGAFEWE